MKIMYNKKKSRIILLLAKNKLIELFFIHLLPQKGNEK